MADQFYKLPAARSLAVFANTGRTLNLSATARDLGLSQAAVSKQIQIVEAHVGQRLFNRSNRGLTFTAAGRRFHDAVVLGLSGIVDVLEELKPKHVAGRVTITTTLALASVWLMPRIAAFRAAHGDIDIRLIATDQVLDLAKEGIDLALRYGTPPWTDCEQSFLFGISLFPVASPLFLKEHGPISRVEDLAEATLLHIDEPNSRDADWRVWLEAVGAPKIEPRRELRFNNYPLLVQAAVGGQGVALGWGNLIEDLTASGALECCLPIHRDLKEGFYLVRAKHAPFRKEVQALAEWFNTTTAHMRRRS